MRTSQTALSLLNLLDVLIVQFGKSSLCVEMPWIRFFIFVTRASVYLLQTGFVLAWQLVPIWIKCIVIKFLRVLCASLFRSPCNIKQALSYNTLCDCNVTYQPEELHMNPVTNEMICMHNMWVIGLHFAGIYDRFTVRYVSSGPLQLLWCFCLWRRVCVHYVGMLRCDGWCDFRRLAASSVLRHMSFSIVYLWTVKHVINVL